VKVLALDLSTHTGWAVFESGNLTAKGLLEVPVLNFNVNKKPEKAPDYPFNLLDASNQMAGLVLNLWKAHAPDVVVIENTVMGRNRNTQRLLEFIHKSVLEILRFHKVKPLYMDPSEWRALIRLRMTKEDLKNNKLVSAGKSRGKITRKHLSVRYVNENFGLAFGLKDNDIADAICLGAAALQRLSGR